MFYCRDGAARLGQCSTVFHVPAVPGQLRCDPQAKKQAMSLLVEAEALKQQLAARDASLAQAAQRLQAVDAKGDAIAVGHALKVQTPCTLRLYCDEC